MFKNKHIDGKCNRCGEQIAKLRKQLPDKTSQRILADRMQEKGIDMDKNAIQRIPLSAPPTELGKSAPETAQYL